VLSLDAQNHGIVYAGDYKRVVTWAVVWSGTSWMLSGGLCYGGVSGSG
jgi:hypothetical protein